MNGNNELIVLVHGFGAKRAVFWPLSIRLRAGGFRVVQWNYLSLFAKIESHAHRLHDFLATQLTKEPRVHLVAHSMGAIVTRAALNRSPLPNLGRIVLLAPPNSGSPIARLASHWIGNVVNPARELSDRHNSYVKQLREPSGLEIGIIAARYDLLVPVRNTQLVEARMHETLLATHNSLLLSRTVSAMTSRFLSTGDFHVPDSHSLH